MSRVDNWEEIITNLDSNGIGQIQEELSAYFNQTIMNEEAIEGKINELFPH